MRLKAQGVDVVDFGAGEPDFPTPAHIGAAAHARDRRATSRNTRTTPGTDDLQARRSSSATRPTTASTTPPSEVIVTAGGKQALFNTVARAVRPRRRSDHARAGLADARRADQARRRDAGHRARRTPRTASRCTPTSFLAAITPRTRGDHHQLADQSDRRADRRRRISTRSRGSCAQRGIWILRRSLLRAADLRPGAAQPAEGPVRHELRDRLGALRLGVEGLRDDRLALRLGDRRRGADRQRCNAIQSHSTSNVCSITQKAARSGAARTAGVRDRDAGRVPPPPRPAPRLADGGSAASACVKPAGAFYLFPDVSELLSPDGDPHVSRVRHGAARRSARRGDARRGVRRAGIPAHSYATSMERARARVAAHPASIAEFAAARDGSRR